MKIFIAFFGLPRCSSITLPSIEKNILQVCRDSAQVTVGYHLYLQSEVKNPRSGENGELSQDNYDWFKSYPGVLEPPGQVPILQDCADLRRFGDAFDDGYASYNNLLLQLHSLDAVSRQAQAAQPDVVLYLRPDLYYHDPLDPRVLNACARDGRRVVVPDWQWGVGVNDRFGVCGRTASPLYARRLQYARQYCNSASAPLHSESLLEYALKENHLRVRTMSLRASRVRISGEIKEEDFRVTETLMGGRRRHLEHRLLRALSAI